MQQPSMLVNNFTCPHCPFSTLFFMKLENHLRDVHGEIANQPPQLQSPCALCLENFPDDNTLYAHLRAKHVDCPDLKLCDYCEYATFIKEKFNEHIIHHDALIAPRYARTCVCEKCNFVSRNSLAFLRHLRDVHKEKIVIHSCDECTYATKQLHKLRRHKDLVHKAKRLKLEMMQSKQFPLKQQQNDKLTNEIDAVSHRLPFIKPELIIGNSSNMFMNGDVSISINNGPINNRPDSQIMELTSNQEPSSDFFKCSKCDYCHKINWVVRRHERLQHFKKKLWKCTECSFTTYKMTRLTQHKKVHEKLIYICDKCEFTTANKLDFLRHSKSHEDLFKCDLCSFSAYSKPAITTHRSKYHLTSEMPSVKANNFENEAFSIQGEFAQNNDDDEWEIVEEPDERPHQTRKKSEHLLQKIDPEEKRRALTCQVCGYEAKWLSELVRHNRVHTGEGPFKCDICSFETKWTGDLSRHFLVHHGLIRTFVKGPRAKRKRQVDNVNIQSDYVDYLKEKPNLLENTGMVLNPNESSLISSNLEDMDSEMLIEETPDGKIIVQKTSKFKKRASNTNKARLKKRYNCRHCSYFTRFHSRYIAHMQAHDNKRPFKCSLCGYRSNWRWDVNKHIKNRMKTHNNATVLFLPSEDLQSPQEVIEGCADPNDKFSEELENKGDLPVPNNNHLDNDAEINSENSGWFIDFLWKCTKCSFKNEDKSVSQEHSLSHLGHKNFSCKLCHYKCNGKNAILRHVRSKHKGHSAKLVECFQYEQIDDIRVDSTASENSVQKVKCLKCKLCPYITLQTFEMNYHVSQHKPRAGTSFKCTYCPYYVSVRQLLWNHLKLHVSNPASSLTEKQTIIKDKNEELVHPSSPSHPFLSTEIKESKIPPPKKKLFECSKCPYKTKSPSDLSYHSNFHKPNPRALHKCLHCDYWISKRHLLTQHMKVHRKPNLKPKVFENVNDVFEPRLVEENIESVEINIEDLETDDEDDISSTDASKDSSSKRNKDIPLVWIKKNGTLERVYKCRFCPHTNKRRANIRSHEKMHRKRKTVGLFKCPYCEYYVSNRGALSVHLKDHKDKGLISGEKDELLKIDAMSLISTEGEIAKNLYNVYTITQSSGDNSVETFADEDQTPPLYFAISPTNRGDSKTIYRYRCGKCPALFSRTIELEVHTKFHGTNYAFKCDQCDYSAKAQAHLTRHMNVHLQKEDSIIMRPLPPPRQRSLSPSLSRSSTPPKKRRNAYCPEDRRFKCPFCPAAFHKISGLIHHKSLHNGKEKYKCSKCTYSVRFFANLQRHAKVHQNSAEPTVSPAFVKKSSGSGILKCHKCPAAFTKEQRLQIHIRLHGSNQKFKCDYCDYSVKFFANLQRHSQVHGQKLKTVANKKKSIKCDRCPAYFSKTAGLKCHYSFHGSNLPFKCELCDYAVNYSGNLRKHVKIHHGRAYIPTITKSPSAKSIHYNNNLVREKLMDISEIDSHQLLTNDFAIKKLFQCYRCPYASARKDSVHSHLKMHFDHHNLNCPHCDYSTELASILKQHIILHFRNLASKVDAYMKHEDVQVCVVEDNNKLTVIEDFVQKKRKEQEESNSFVCQYCDRPFSEEDALKKHELQHLIGYSEEKAQIILPESDYAEDEMETEDHELFSNLEINVETKTDEVLPTKEYEEEKKYEEYSDIANVNISEKLEAIDTNVNEK